MNFRAARRIIPVILAFLVLACDRVGPDDVPIVEDTSQLLSLLLNQDLALFRDEEITLPFSTLVREPSKLRLDVTANGDCAEVRFDPEDGAGSLTVRFPESFDGDNAVVKLVARYGGTFKTYVVGLRLKTMALDVGDLYFESGDVETKRVFSWVKANYAGYTLSVTSDVDWIVISDDQGTVRVLQNETDELRTGHISVLDDTGRFSSGILVSQEPAMRRKPGFVFFDDRKFKKGVLEAADEDGDGEISLEEARRIRRLELPGRGIRSILGVEEMEGIQYLDVSGNQIDSADFSDYAVFHDLKHIDLRGNPLEKCNSAEHGHAVNCGGCYEGPSFEFLGDCGQYSEPKYYESAHVFDGDLVCLQQHIRGNGLYFFLENPYLLDYAYTNGAAEDFFTKMLETIFAVEPFKSFRDCFSVYYYKVSAPNTERAGAISNTPDLFNELRRVRYTVPIFIRKGVIKTVFGQEAAGTAKDVGYSQYFLSDVTVENFIEISDYAVFGSTLLHELGHDLGGLCEEFVDIRGTGPNSCHTDDPEKVPWARFLEIDRYKTRVGIYPVGTSYIPSPPGTSYMSSGANRMCYNSPSRYEIYKTIYWCTYANMETLTGPSEEEMWVAFLEYDVVNDSLPY